MAGAAIAGTPGFGTGIGRWVPEPERGPAITAVQAKNANIAMTEDALMWFFIVVSHVTCLNNARWMSYGVRTASEVCIYAIPPARDLGKIGYRGCFAYLRTRHINAP